MREGIDYDRLLRIRDSENGFKAPLPREAGKANAFFGLTLRSFLAFRIALRSLGFDLEAAGAPSISISMKSQLALAHSTSVVYAGQRQTQELRRG
jgi:hypothetical protein